MTVEPIECKEGKTMRSKVPNFDNLSVEEKIEVMEKEYRRMQILRWAGVYLEDPDEIKEGKDNAS